MPTITLATRNGPVTTQATFLTVISGTTPHKLALHKNAAGEWLVSDPVSGGSITRVNCYYKGLPCSSKTLRAKEAIEFAVADVEALISKIGADKFNKVMSAGVLK